MGSPRDRAWEECNRLERETAAKRRKIVESVLVESGSPPGNPLLNDADEIVVGYVNAAMADYLQTYDQWSLKAKDKEDMYVGIYRVVAFLLVSGIAGEGE